MTRPPLEFDPVIADLRSLIAQADRAVDAAKTPELQVFYEKTRNDLRVALGRLRARRAVAAAKGGAP